MNDIVIGILKGPKVTAMIYVIMKDVVGRQSSGFEMIRDGVHGTIFVQIVA